MFQLPSGLNACMQKIMEIFAVLGMGICLLLLNRFMTMFALVSIVILLIITRVMLSRPIRSA